MRQTFDKTIGQIVAEDYRTAQIFKNHKIDFCCKGNRSLQEVAEKHKLDLDDLIKELVEVQDENKGETTDFKLLPLDQLTEYIENKHHRYVEATIPALKQYLNKLCKVHGERHPELLLINEQFNHSARELSMHMKKEELILFPWICKMARAQEQQMPLGEPHFGSVGHPIQMMLREHDNEGERFRQISSLSNNYTPPADACNTYRVAFSLLREFEEDLHRHIHLENNILFPKAVALEQELTV